jgi:hypothetical protein
VRICVIMVKFKFFKKKEKKKEAKKEANLLKKRERERQGHAAGQIGHLSVRLEIYKKFPRGVEIIFK